MLQYIRIAVTISIISAVALLVRVVQFFTVIYHSILCMETCRKNELIFHKYYKKYNIKIILNL